MVAEREAAEREAKVTQQRQALRREEEEEEGRRQKREEREEKQQARAEREESDRQDKQDFQNTLNMIQAAGNNISASIAQTAAQTQMTIANAQAAQRRQQEEQREREREQQQAHQRQQEQQRQQAADQQRQRDQQLADQKKEHDLQLAEQKRQQEERERNTCHNVNGWIAVTSRKEADYTYCKVNFHTGAGLTAGITNNGSKTANVNVCAYNASGMKIKCVDYDLSPGQSLGGWATELVWCGAEPRSVKYNARLRDDPERCNQM